MQNELDIIRDVSFRLEEGGLQFMLTGSMAMNYYTQPRMTRDIDIVVALRKEDVDKVFKIFTADYYISRQAVIESIEKQSMFNLIHNESIIKVDCIVRKDDEYRLIEFERRKKISIGSFSTYIVSKEDLIISKLFWAKDSISEMQFKDVKNLLLSGYDSAYLNLWIKKLKLDHLLEKLPNE